jgi:hypothetical protein
MLAGTLDMKIILGFLPFLVFVLACAAGYSKLGLLAGAVVAGMGIMRDALATHGKPKILDIGTFALFGALTIVAWATDTDPSIALVRIGVDAGLLIIVITAMLIGKPVTLEYAKHSVPPSQWNDACFIRTNNVISMAWAIALAIAVLADVALWRHAMPTRSVAMIIVGALYAAARFTQWFPRHRREHAVAQR